MLQGAAASFYGAARTVMARASNPSEVASLGGKKAKTPIIAGSICGGVMLLAWIIGFAIYFRKRYNRKKRNRLVTAGKSLPRQKDLEQPKEKVVIPPDPAVLLGQRKPGESAFPEREHSQEGHHLPWSHHGSSPNSRQNSSTPRSSPKNTQETAGDKQTGIVDKINAPANV